MADTYRIDSTKISFHPQRVAQWLEGHDTWEQAKKCYPIYAEVTTAAACNHRCTFCSVDALEYKNIMLDDGILRNTMYEMGKLGVKSVMFAGTGEPLLHKNINEIVWDARVSGLEVAFTTNGVLLHKLAAIDLCTWVKLSVNGGTREDYAAIHRTNPKDWDSIWSHLPEVLSRKGNCQVGLQCVVLPENYMGMDNLATLSRNVGVDYLVLKPYSQGTFSIVQRDIDYREMQDYLQTLPAKFNTDKFEVVYRANAIKQESEEHHYEKCLATPFMWVYVKADGDVFTCSAHLLDPRFCIGNLYKQSFPEIWEGEKRRENWEMMKETFSIKQCRKNCRQNQVNIYLDQVKHGIPHQNFI